MFATMRAAVALQLLLASSAQAQSPLPVEVDCALRELALDYGSQLLTHTKGGNDTTPLAQSLFWPVDTCGNKTKKRIPPRKTSPVNAAATCGNAAQNGGAANFYVSALGKIIFDRHERAILQGQSCQRLERIAEKNAVYNTSEKNQI